MLEGTEVSPGTCALEIEFARYLRFWNGAARLRAADRFRFAFGRERGGDRIRMLEATCLPVQAASSDKEAAYFVLHRGKVRFEIRLQPPSAQSSNALLCNVE
jgi:hypothetical protein